MDERREDIRELIKVSQMWTSNQIRLILPQLTLLDAAGIPV